MFNHTQNKYGKSRCSSVRYTRLSFEVLEDRLAPALVFVSDIRQGQNSSTPLYLAPFRVGNTDGVMFSAVTGGGDRRLHFSDGTNGGTIQIRANAGVGPLNARELTPIGTTVFFFGSNGVETELWKTNGTDQGTGVVKDINPNGSSDPMSLVVMNNVLYFIANDGTNGRQVWKSDGTANGTVRISDINPGVGANKGLFDLLTPLAVAGNTIYFKANDGTNGTELWKTTGTMASTVMVKNINNGANSSDPYGFTATGLGASIVFAADDGTTGVELWKSDGTTAGTVRVADINGGNNGAASSNPNNFIYVPMQGGMVIFSANDGTNGTELWKYDGTNASLLKDINPNAGSSSPSQMTLSGNTLFFNAFAPNTGNQLYKSDGTAAGTVLVSTNQAANMNPRYMAAKPGSGVYFSGTVQLGGELYTSDGTAGGTVAVAVPAGWALDTIQVVPVLAANGTFFLSGRTHRNQAALGVELWKIAPPRGAQGPNQAPAGTNTNVTIQPAMPYSFNVGDFGFTDPSDTPPDNFQAVKITTVPAGTLDLFGQTVNAGDFVSVSDINACGLTFTGTQNDSFTFQVQDDGGTDNSGVDLDATARTMTISASSVNTAPINTAPWALSMNEDTTLVFSSANAYEIAVSDDSVSASIQVALAATNGTLTLSGTSGLSFSFSDANGSGTGDGTNDSTMRFRGSMSNINAALNGLAFTPTPNYNGGASVEIVTNDLGNTGSGGALTDTDTVSITVDAVNDAPVNTVPASQYTLEDASLDFSAGNGNAISIGDLDAGNEDLQVTLTATHGTVTLSSTTGLSFSFSDSNGTGAGDGTADTTMTFRGTVSAINAALNGLTFIPTSNYVGDATVELVSNDLGNSGSGGALADDDTVTIHVVNFLANDASYSTKHDVTLTAPNMMQMTNGLLYYVSNPQSLSLAVGAIDGDDTIIGDPVTTAMGGTLTVESDGSFVYDPPANWAGDDWFAYTVSDGTYFSTATIILHVTNSTPTFDEGLMGYRYSTTMNQSITAPNEPWTFGLLHYADDDDGDTLTITAVNGDPDNLDQAISTSEGGTITVSADGSFDYTPPTDWTGDDEFDITISDGITSITVTIVIRVTS
ncbi:MAG: cadherin-like domain-containing protein [Planctomycetes bacterium]|nr:cadherin-like domain-containing protein [Planctomycetota bacterium]